MTDQEYKDWWRDLHPSHQGGMTWHSEGTDTDLLMAATLNPTDDFRTKALPAIKKAHARFKRMWPEEFVTT